MFDILKTVILVHIIAYISDIILIGIVAYLFTNSINTSIGIALISYLIMWIKNSIFNKYFLS